MTGRFARWCGAAAVPRCRCPVAVAAEREDRRRAPLSRRQAMRAALEQPIVERNLAARHSRVLHVWRQDRSDEHSRSGLNPRSTDCSREEGAQQQAARRRAAPAQCATSATMSDAPRCCGRACPSVPRAPSRSAGVNAGARRLQRRHQPEDDAGHERSGRRRRASTVQSRPISPQSRRASGAIAASAGNAPDAERTPSAPARWPSSRLSVSSCRTSAPRVRAERHPHGDLAGARRRARRAEGWRCSRRR